MRIMIFSISSASEGLDQGICALLAASILIADCKISRQDIIMASKVLFISEGDSLARLK